VTGLRPASKESAQVIANLSNGYRIIARKDGEQVRLWACTTSDYSKAFPRVRDAVGGCPSIAQVLDGEAIVVRSADRCDFEALRSRQGQAEAILVAYDLHGGGRAGRGP
jgi:ATP-dependent DNA ligase